MSPANFIVLGGKLRSSEHSQSGWRVFALALYSSGKKSSSLCCFSDLCESYCSVEDQWIQMNMKGLALETLGGSLTRLHYSPAVLNKHKFQMNHR